MLIEIVDYTQAGGVAMGAMRTLKGGRRALLLAIYSLLVIAFTLPLMVRTTSDGAFRRGFSGWRMMNGVEWVEAGGEVYSGSKKLEIAPGERKADLSHWYAMALLAVAVGGGVALLDRDGRKKYAFGLIASIAGVAVCAYLLKATGGTYAISADIEGLPMVADRAGLGLKVMTVLFALSTGVSALCLGERGDEPKKQASTKLVTRVGVLGAVAAVLYIVPEIPVIPPIYKLDFSTVPVLLGGFSMGIGPALAILALKDLTGLLHTSSMGVGELADFLASGAFVVVAAAIYARRRTLKGALIGMGAGIAAMVAVGALANYYIMIPFYVQVMGMPLEAIISAIAGTIPAVDSLPKLIALATTPFNLLKGVVLSLITTILYKRISPLLKSL